MATGLEARGDDHIDAGFFQRDASSTVAAPPTVMIPFPRQVRRISGEGIPKTKLKTAGEASINAATWSLKFRAVPEGLGGGLTPSSR
jgi:hypothetical protein